MSKPEKEKPTNSVEESKEQSMPTPDLLKEAFDVFSRASSQLEQSYNELKERADRLAKELALTNAELQKQLAEKEKISNFLENILLSIPSGIIVFDETGKIVISNEVAHTIFYNAEFTEDATVFSVLTNQHLADFISQCLENKTGRFVSKDFEFESEENESRSVINVGYAPVVNSNGQHIASLLVAQDVSRLRELEDQAMRTNRLAAMGEMAAQLAHEIRNPLGSIEIFASLLGRDLRGTDNQKLADNIVVGVKSLNAVVTNMLTFTRSVQINPEPVEVNEVVTETVNFLEHVLAMENIALDLELDNETGRVVLDVELIKQVLLNLAQNAVYAMEDTSAPSLGIKTRRADHEDGRVGVEISVRDNGCGMEEDEVKKIFDPFYSTRRGGTGLGLSVVSQIVEKHHGLIIPESKPGRGTVMRLWLPDTIS
jgi:PAS domain S-box-containing protein